MFRWNQSLNAAGTAALAAVLAVLPVVMGDWHITGQEIYMLVVLAGSTFFAYLKDHPPA